MLLVPHGQAPAEMQKLPITFLAARTPLTLRGHRTPQLLLCKGKAGS